MDTAQKHEAWNKGKTIGQKPPLKPKDVWAIRVHLQNKHAVRDLAMFNLAIDSKLRGCDVVSLRAQAATLLWKFLMVPRLMRISVGVWPNSSLKRLEKWEQSTKPHSNTMKEMRWSVFRIRCRA